MKDGGLVPLCMNTAASEELVDGANDRAKAGDTGFAVETDTPCSCIRPRVLFTQFSKAKPFIVTTEGIVVNQDATLPRRIRNRSRWQRGVPKVRFPSDCLGYVQVLRSVHRGP